MKPIEAAAHTEKAKAALAAVKQPGGPANYDKLHEALSEIIAAIEALMPKG